MSEFDPRWPTGRQDNPGQPGDQEQPGHYGQQQHGQPGYHPQGGYYGQDYRAGLGLDRLLGGQRQRCQRECGPIVDAIGEGGALPLIR